MGTLPYQNRDDARQQRRDAIRQRFPGYFGPTHAQIWSQLAEQIGARFVPGHWSRSDRIIARAGAWTVTLDGSDGNERGALRTRLRAPFVNPDGFRFAVYPITLRTMIGAMLGAQDITVGHPEFDRDLVIKGNNPEQVRRLFANAKLRELVRQAMLIPQGTAFEVRDDDGWFGQQFPQGVDELRLLSFEPVTTIEQLRRLFDMFSETLRTLCQIGSAYERDPGVELR